VEELPCQGRSPIANRESFSLSFARAQDAAHFADRLPGFLEAAQWPVPKLTKKGEPSEVDVRPMVRSVTEGEEGFVIEFDWENLYVSPIFVLQAIDPEFTLLEGRLIKTAQFF
jgi:hypothetical protein